MRKAQLLNNYDQHRNGPGKTWSKLAINHISVYCLCALRHHTASRRLRSTLLQLVGYVATQVICRSSLLPPAWREAPGSCNLFPPRFPPCFLLPNNCTVRWRVHTKSSNWRLGLSFFNLRLDVPLQLDGARFLGVSPKVSRCRVSLFSFFP